MFVITNSRRFAIRKLLAMQAKPPWDNFTFVTEASNLNPPDIPLPAIILWQRGRLSEDQKELRTQVDQLLAEGSLREATIEEVRSFNV